MTTALFTHAACLAHDTGFGHPECADRLRAVLRGLEGESFAFLDRREAPKATMEQIARVHPLAHIKEVLGREPGEGLAHIDADTVMSPGSGEAALRAAGAVCLAVDDVMAGRISNAFCAVRPPGHHAEPDQAMGFCLFNNVAIGAMHARMAHNLERVAVVDFDVHHGNGTQSFFENDAGLFYASTHQWPLYPGTGAPQERGIANNILNIALTPNAGSLDFRDAVTRELLPALNAFAPQLLLISAGFDAHADDPLANLNLSTDDFGWITHELGIIAARHAHGRMISSLEGGYNLRALAASARMHVEALMNAPR